MWAIPLGREVVGLAGVVELRELAKGLISPSLWDWAGLGLLQSWEQGQGLLGNHFAGKDGPQSGPFE